MKKTMKLFAISVAMLFALLFAACQNGSDTDTGSGAGTGSPAEYTSGTYTNAEGVSETDTVSFANGIWVSSASGENWGPLQTGYGTYAGDASVDGTLTGTITKWYNSTKKTLEDVNPPEKLTITIADGKFVMPKTNQTFTRK